MNITKNGFYKLSDIKASKIIIEDNLVVSIFDDLNKNLDIEIGENSRVEFYGYVENTEELNVNFIQNKPNSKLSVKYLLFSDNYKKIKARIYSELACDTIVSDVKILSIIGNDGSVDLDGIIQINENVVKVYGDLQEENLFLGNNGKAKGIPTLLVRSDDVKASHACKMERISDEKLFYLRSRGVGKDNALSMMIEAKIISLFSCISMLDNDFYEELINSILLKIK